MDHQLAVKSQAVERYFLGEMDPDEREAFEEHFFSCELCGSDVRATSTFVENARVILTNERGWPRPARGWVTRGLLGWIRPSFALAAAAAVCLSVVIYQNIEVIPELKAPQSLNMGVALEGPTRSAAPKLREGEPLHFVMPFEGGATGNHIWAELDKGSRRVKSGEVPAPAANQPLDLYFPGKLDPGSYSVVLRDDTGGRPGRELMRSDFEVI